ncbi:TcfC E-set like domain-containing protein [Endozoicomonas sp. SCSIO W0465]|uniref:TcfC E-set like domain-containing protein n=1 Tax=Endozoicomonas sp. SCSIO W0465 TaxID=2918516 RepID=UPI002075B624|nr:TcfC E-set like domain-containing protein [Endozoicomonas sp. SCSIO W0465]USE37017.1 TcfC E-set like domain-containing protein [Endozoicomonas sp. SCSIO W0465]
MLCAFSMFAFSNMAQADDPIFLAATPPPGFEELSDTQQSLVDIYFGNRYIGSQLAWFSPGIIELPNPAELVRQIGNLNDPTLIVSTLTGELNSHADLVCLTNSSQNCGILATSVAGVIFDESRFRVDIFINRRFMLTRAADVRKYLPPSDAGFALMQNFSAAVSGSSAGDSDNSYTLNGLTMAAWKENSIYWSWDYSDTNHFSVNQFYGQRDFEGVEYNAGLLSTSGFGFNLTSDQPMVGLRINSSDNTREDLDFSGGMPVEVFLPTRGRVEVRKDDRLLDSSFFEAGSQQLDTTSFPSGAYNIEIRILDESGNLISTETRFFAKQSQIPPIGEWLYFMETGRVVNREADNALPEITEQWLSRAGASRRVFDTLAATGAVAIDNNDALMEFGLYHFGYRYEISPSLMLADNGSEGFTVNGRLTLGDLSLSGNYRRLWHDEVIDNDIDQNGDGLPGLFGNAFEQHSFSASMPLFDGSLGYRYSLNQSYDDNNEEQDPTRTHSLDYRRTLFRTFDYDSDVTVSLSKSDDTEIGLVSFSFRYREDRWNFRATPAAEISKRDGQTDSSERMRLSTSWDDGNLLDGDLRFDVGVEGGSGDDRMDGSVQYANRYGRASFSTSHTRGSDSNTTSWGGSMSTSFLTDGDVFALGGEERAESALVVNLDGRPGDVFDVKVNGQRRGYAIAGSPSIIALSPYKQYRVSLSPAGETLYSFDEREKNVTLYPGNVMTLNYEAIPLQLLFGRLLFNGQPLKGARINGGLYPGSTDGIGMFQLETRSDVGNLQVELNNGWLCQLPVKPLDAGYVLQMGTIDLADAQCGPLLEGQLAISKRREAEQ